MLYSSFTGTTVPSCSSVFGRLKSYNSPAYFGMGSSVTRDREKVSVGRSPLYDKGLVGRVYIVHVEWSFGNRCQFVSRFFLILPLDGW